MNVALAWRPQKGSGADLAVHMQRTVVWKRVQRVLTHPDVEKALKQKLGVDAPIKFREFFFVREMPGHNLGVHTGNNGKKARAGRLGGEAQRAAQQLRAFPAGAEARTTRALTRATLFLSAQMIILQIYLGNATSALYSYGACAPRATLPRRLLTSRQLPSSRCSLTASPSPAAPGPARPPPGLHTPDQFGRRSEANNGLVECDQRIRYSGNGVRQAVPCAAAVASAARAGGWGHLPRPSAPLPADANASVHSNRRSLSAHLPGFCAEGFARELPLVPHRGPGDAKGQHRDVLVRRRPPDLAQPRPACTRADWLRIAAVTRLPARPIAAQVFGRVRGRGEAGACGGEGRGDKGGEASHREGR